MNLQLPKVGHLLQKFTQVLFFADVYSLIKDPITRFCASKCFISLNKSTTGFWFFKMVFDTDSSFCLKLASFVHPAIGHVQIYFTLYLFAKFTGCQKKFFHVFARCFAQELLLKVNVHRKVYTAWLVLIKGLEKLLGRAFRCFVSSFLCILFQGKEIKPVIFLYNKTYKW